MLLRVARKSRMACCSSLAPPLWSSLLGLSRLPPPLSLSLLLCSPTLASRRLLSHRRPRSPETRGFSRNEAACAECPVARLKRAVKIMGPLWNDWLQ